MGDIVIILILIVIVGVAVMGTVKRVRHGSACCGEHDAAPKKVRVSDHNKNNYPYAYEIEVDGMHCSNCTRRVENAFNKQDGYWAKADLADRKVTLMSKGEVREEVCTHIISDAGYTMLNMRNIKNQEEI
ncbi:MAG: heavy-metal-associated domain-containing protein [Clostridiales bacterium]|nr:heavy-metal-associated domain-containing protein [Clostridiales bacterium]